MSTVVLSKEDFELLKKGFEYYKGKVAELESQLKPTTVDLDLSGLKELFSGEAEDEEVVEEEKKTYGVQDLALSVNRG